MLDKLNNELKTNEIQINKYLLNEPNDILDNKKINFYYLLLKYILKDAIYIYQYNFLLRARKTIITKIIKNRELFENNEKIMYIIEKLVDFKYYLISYLFNRLINKTISNNESISSGDKDEVIEEKNNKMNLYVDMEKMEQILDKSSFIFKTDENISIIILNDDKEEITQNKIRSKKTTKIGNDYNILLKNFTKFIEFLLYIKEEIQKQFKNNYNLLIRLKFNKEYINNNSNSIFDITCRYKFYPLNNFSISSLIDENILVKGNYQGFTSLIKQINDYDYVKEKEYIEKRNEKEEKNEKEEEISKFDKVISEEVSEYKIIQFKKIITIHSNSADFLYKLSNGYYVSGGNQREIYIYDQAFNKKVVFLRNKPVGVCEIKCNDNTNLLEIIAYSYENLSLISYEMNQKNNPKVHAYNISAINLLQIENNNFIINSEKGGYISKDCFYKKSFRKMFKHTYNVGININDKLSTFTSNKVMPNGKDHLIFYDKISNKIIFVLEGYSFSLSKNSLILINNKKPSNNDKILICACKKYLRNQRNGILLVNISIEEKFNDEFYDTGNFEPFCFSQICIVNKSYEDKKNTYKIYDTNYLFVGGFNQEKGIGEIYLYKINYESPANNITINAIQEIILDKDNNFEGFNGAITSIIQTDDTGNFIISCSDGNIYLFSQANMNYFLFCDEEEKKGLKYETLYI